MPAKTTPKIDRRFRNAAYSARSLLYELFRMPWPVRVSTQPSMPARGHVFISNLDTLLALDVVEKYDPERHASYKKIAQERGVDLSPDPLFQYVVPGKRAVEAKGAAEEERKERDKRDAERRAELQRRRREAQRKSVAVQIDASRSVLAAIGLEVDRAQNALGPHPKRRDAARVDTLTWGAIAGVAKKLRDAERAIKHDLRSIDRACKVLVDGKRLFPKSAADVARKTAKSKKKSARGRK